LIYNGDTDPAINSYRSQDWVSKLGFNETQSWRPWTTDSCQRMGGYVTRYENGLDHLTIRGSGHMVPLFKPEISLEFITRFIRNEDYLSYDSTCSYVEADYQGEDYYSELSLLQEGLLKATQRFKLREDALLHKLNILQRHRHIPTSNDVLIQ